MKSRLLFWGTGAIAVPIFERLQTMPEIRIVGVVTQPDAPIGRHQTMTAPPMKKPAEQANVPVFQPTTFKDEEFFARIEEQKPDIALVFAYGRIIPQRFLDIPKQGTLNVHPSLLPKHRGPTPVHAAILEGDIKTGVTLIVLDAEMDHGPIIAQSTLLLSGAETTETLSDALAEHAADLVAASLPLYLAGKITPREQEHALATSCKLLDRESGKIDWSLPAETILRQARAYTPWPGIWTIWKDGKKSLRLKIFLPEETKTILAPGNIQLQDDALLIGTGTTALRISELQIEGKKRMSAAEALRGNGNFLQGRCIS